MKFDKDFHIHFYFITALKYFPPTTYFDPNIKYLYMSYSDQILEEQENYLEGARSTCGARQTLWQGANALQTGPNGALGTHLDTIWLAILVGIPLFYYYHLTILASTAWM